mmetsp:Transcript_3971/g.8659  ORF Transcript_3971/g.8659 Transcript_3971/m.8659 type:complete len:220 (-) Transcript_3971:761-1420(-)
MSPATTCTHVQPSVSARLRRVMTALSFFSTANICTCTPVVTLARRVAATRGPRPAPTTATIMGARVSVSPTSTASSPCSCSSCSRRRHTSALSRALSYCVYLTGSLSKVSYVIASRLSIRGCRGTCRASSKPDTCASAADIEGAGVGAGVGVDVGGGVGVVEVDADASPVPASVLPATAASAVAVAAAAAAAAAAADFPSHLWCPSAHHAAHRSVASRT